MGNNKTPARIFVHLLNIAAVHLFVSVSFWKDKQPRWLSQMSLSVRILFLARITIRYELIIYTPCQDYSLSVVSATVKLTVLCRVSFEKCFSKAALQIFLKDVRFLQQPTQGDLSWLN